MKTEILVTPSEETTLIDLKQGEIDPVIKWNFAWSYEKRNLVTRLGYNKIENKILGMNDPDHKETVFLETVQFGAMAGEVNLFLPYPPIPDYQSVKDAVVKIIQDKLVAWNKA